MCRIYVFTEFYKQTRVEISRFRGWQCFASKRIFVNNTMYTFCLGSKFFNFFLKPECEPNIAGAPSVQIPQTFFHSRFAESKTSFHFFHNILSSCGSFQIITKKKCFFDVSQMNISHKTSNWAHEVTLFDSSTWKEKLSFHLSPASSRLLTYLKCASQ